jgi:hypothetical protein
LVLFAQTPPPPTALTPADTTYFQGFGWAVAADGDTVVVGAVQDCPFGFYNAGAAYVFVRNSDGWTEQAKLVAHDAADFVQFGGAVAVSGDTILVGARYDSVNAGAVYVFTRQGNQWAEQDKLAPTDATPGQEFGCAVALDGEVLGVGALADGEGGYNSGAAYVFEWVDNAWVQKAKLRSTVPQPGDLFGFSIAVSGDSVVVGAPFNDEAGLDAGAAHVFTRDASGWTRQAEVYASDPAPNDVFGWAVAIAGNRTLIGAPQKSGSAECTGAAYVSVRSGSLWAPEAKLVAPSPGANDFFGYAVALRGTRAAVGAPLSSLKAQINGAAYLFRQNAGAWGPECEPDTGIVSPGDQLGFSVALADSWLAVGAPFNDQTYGFDNGAAYAFALASPNAPPVADASATAPEIISLNRVDAAVTLDGSRSSDPDQDALTFTWSVGGVTLATGSTAVVTLPVGTHEITLLVTDGSLSSVATMLVAVVAPPNAPPVADASATVREVISPNNRNAEVVLNGSRSADPEGAPLTYRWVEGTNEIGAARVVRVRLPVGRHEITLTVTDGQASDQDLLAVWVITPAMATRSLIQRVEAADLPRARERVMLTMLRVAERSFERGQMNAAAHHLIAFQRVVQAREGRKLDPVTVARLVQAAQRIIDAVPHR